MKLLTKFGLLPVIVALSFAGAGCKHNPKPVTLIPRGTQPGVGPLPSPISGTPVNQGFTGNTGGGVNNGGRPFRPGEGPDGRDLPTVNNNDGNKPEGNTPDQPPLPDTDIRYGRAVDRTLFAADTVYFEYDRFAVKASETDKVKRVAEFLKGNPLHDLAIEGHADERGTEEYNRALAERRALSVRESLVSLGISGSRITTTSFGEDQPADPGHDDAAWTKNRRGEFIILLPSVK